MRILSVSWECPVGWYGGLGVYLSRLLPEMAGEHEVDHYCLHGDVPIGDPYVYHGVRVIRPEDVLVDKNQSVFYRSAVALASHLYKHIGRYDLVIGHDAHSSLVVIYAFHSGVKTIYSLHLFSFQGIDIDAVNHSSAVIVNSWLLGRKVLGIASVGNMHVVYPAPPYPLVGDPPEKNNGKPVILIPSRFQFNKDPSRVLPYLEEARKKIDFSVVVFGRGSELYSKALPSWISIAGTVSEQEKINLYRRADLTLMVGFPEPFGLVSLESISQGTPVIVPDTSGSAEVLPSESVYTLDNLAEKIVWLLEERERLLQLWEKQRRSWIMQRSWRDVWMDYDSVIKGIGRSASHV